VYSNYISGSSTGKEYEQGVHVDTYIQELKKEIFPQNITPQLHARLQVHAFLQFFVVITTRTWAQGRIQDYLLERGKGP